MSAPYRYDSTETGAPTLNNAPGSLIALLRAVLKNGFNVKAISSISVASGIATVTCPGHGYACGIAQILRITGASAPALDGDKQPTLVDANTFTYPAPGVADGSYTATDARRAPLGWVETFSDGLGTKAIFSRSAVEANAIDLRVDDTGVAPATTSAARVIMVNGATGINTYTAQAPTEAQVAGGYVATKIANTATAKQWLAIGTERDFFLFVADSGSAQYFPAICFYDGVAFRPGDASFTVLSGTSTSAVNSTTSQQFKSAVLSSTPSGVSGGVIFSDETGIGSPEPFAIGPLFKTSGGHGDSTSGSSTDPLDFVVGFDAHMRGLKAGVRGSVPGNGEPFLSHAALPGPSLSYVQDMDDGGKVLLVRVAYSSASAGMTAFKLSQGWR